MIKSLVSQLLLRTPIELVILHLGAVRVYNLMDVNQKHCGRSQQTPDE